MAVAAPSGTSDGRVAEVVHADAEQANRAAAGLGLVEQRDRAADDVLFVARGEFAVAAGDGREVVVADLDRHRARVEIASGQPARGAVEPCSTISSRMSPRSVRSRRERVLAARRLRLVLGDDRPVVDALRELLQPVGQRADGFAQRAGSAVRTSTSFSMPRARSLRGGDRADAPQRVDRQALQEVLDALRRDDGQAVGLLPAGRDLREELVRAPRPPTPSGRSPRESRP